jgi:hypothetical protein
VKPENAAPEVPKAATPTPPPRPAAQPAKKPTAPTTPRSADWSQLANQLGIEPSTMPQPVAQQPQPPASAREQSASPAVQPRKAPETREAPRPRSSEREADSRRREREPREPRPAAREPRREAPEPPKRREPVPEAVDEFFDEEIIDAELVETDETEGTPEQAGAEGQPGDEERTGRKRRRRRRGGRRSKRDRPLASGEEHQAGGIQPDGDDRDDAGESLTGASDLSDSTSDQEAGEASAVPGEEREPKGRPKRRRRRGSGRGRDKKREEGTEPKGTAAEESERKPSEQLIDDEEDQEDVDFAAVSGGDDIGDDEAESQVDKNSHRAIPAWEEAIGYIVSVNMEARAKNPKSGPPRGRGRGGRGRGTGNSRGGPRRSDHS